MVNLQYDPDEIYARGLSPFQAVLMAAQEARFINEQARLGFYDLKGEKATTVALERLRDKKIQVVEE
jgi:DNA-directed RNA polymerase subunit K/omega